MSDREAHRRRNQLNSLTSCKACGGHGTRRERPHPLGGSLVTLECTSCGDGKPAVKRVRRDGTVTYHKVGGKPKRVRLGDA